MNMGKIIENTKQYLKAVERLFSAEPSVAVAEKFQLVLRCYQLLSRFIANGYMPECPFSDHR